ncbi:MAG TPA: lipoate--protein ligase family protein [Nitrospira sp.]|nr:lipoate--protein ligase family protein [Nitrospira sp.]
MADDGTGLRRRDTRPLRLLDLTLPAPAENLALDEALLDDVDEDGGDPVLRFWESARHFVVLGRSCRLIDDVHLAACREDGLPVLRRASGGGTVLQGPGCLSYAFVLPIDLHPALLDIRETNRFILDRLASVLRRWEPAASFQGISDVAIGGMKISGNAQRRQRRALLFHGTVLHGMRAETIARYLKQPARQPDYRQDRPHAAFLRTIDAKPDEIKRAIAEAWSIEATRDTWPAARLERRIADVLRRTAEEPA